MVKPDICNGENQIIRVRRVWRGVKNGADYCAVWERKKYIHKKRELNTVTGTKTLSTSKKFYVATFPWGGNMYTNIFLKT
jgi:hypothetical protein